MGEGAGGEGPRAPRSKRRSLTNVGGAVETAGDADDAKLLAHALDVVSAKDEDDKDDSPARAHVHGFHTYPARMHPDTASRLATAFVAKGETVLDPFCGSGTVLIEAMIAGRRAIGTDLSPLAVLLARSKTRPRTPRQLEALVEYARTCAAHADERRKAKAGASQRFPPQDTVLFEPHVLLELDSLRLAIAKVGDSPIRDDLWLVLSALLVKLSKKRGDTSLAIDTRRTAAGYTAKLFVKKTEELARRLAEFTALLAKPIPSPAHIAVDDATKLRALDAKTRVDAIITSPPYAATYDYVAHHALRMRWLGLDVDALDAGEIGARRKYRGLHADDARDTWSRELSRFFDAAHRVLQPGAPLVLIMADSAVGSTALRADEIVADLARDHGFIPAARASQPRPHFHLPTQGAFEEKPRAEHALLLRSAG